MKILIVGTVGTGKTTLARKLSKEYNIKYYEIDSIVHDDINKKKRTPQQQNEIISNINKEDGWIIEGVLRENLEYLLETAEKIIYLDIPKNIRNKRILTRYIKQKIGIEKSNYKPSLKMLKMMYKWSNEFEKNRDEFENKLNKYVDKLEVIGNEKTKYV